MNPPDQPATEAWMLEAAREIRRTEHAFNPAVQMAEPLAAIIARHHATRPGAPTKLWCAMCGKWGDHGSGTCPELHPQQPIPIAEREPVFPCWLWQSAPSNGVSPQWYHYTTEEWREVRCLYKNWGSFTHWLPDQPTAPSVRPEQPAAPDVAAPLKPTMDEFTAWAKSAGFPFSTWNVSDAYAFYGFFCYGFDALTPALSALVAERDAAVKNMYEAIEKHDSLLAKVRESCEREGKLAAYLKAARCPDPNCDGKGSSWCVSNSRYGEPEQVQFECQWCRNTTALLTPPPAGTEKGAT